MSAIVEAGRIDLDRRARLLAGRLRLADDLTRGEWVEIGKKLARAGNKFKWLLADWMWEGHYRFGEVYDIAEEVTGYARKTLQNIASVSGRFSSYREDLSFEHHAIVAYLGSVEREAWLDRAEAEGWSCEALRDRLREAKQIPRQSLTFEQLRLSVPVERAERWKQAAEQSGHSFGEWAAEALDQAAA